MRKLMIVAAVAASALLANAENVLLTSSQNLSDSSSMFAQNNKSGTTFAFQYGNGKDDDAKDPIIYSMTGDVTINADNVFIRPGLHRSLTFDLGSFTLYTGANNFQYTTTHKDVLGDGRYCYYFKNGTIDCSKGTGYLKLMGRWQGSGGDRNLICDIDNVDIVSTKSGMTAQWCVGGINNELIVNESSFKIVGDIYALYSGNSETESLSVNNTFTFTNSEVKCAAFSTDKEQVTPTKALDTNSCFVFDNSKLDASSTMCIGSVLGGNTMTFQNGSELNCGGELRLGAGSAFSQNNTLIVNGGSILNLNGKDLSIGHAAGSSGNSVYLENCTVNCGAVKMGVGVGGSDNHLFIGEGAVVNSTAQFMVNGPHNTMTIENGTFRLSNVGYAFYFGHSADSTGNMFTLKGDHPYIEILKDSTKDAELNFEHDTKIDIYLPENGEYQQVPFLVNKFKQSSTAKFRFYNYEKLRKTLTANKEIVIARADAEMWNLYSEGLPEGCTFAKVDRRATTGYFEAVLTLTPSRTKIAQVGTESFYSFDDAAAALADGGSMNLIAVAEPEDSVCTLKDKKDVTITSGDFRTRMIRDLTLDNTTLRCDTSYGNPNVPWGVEGYSLTMRNGSKYDCHSQFVIIGKNNTLTIDNSEVYVQAQYAVYLGWNNDDLPSVNNTVYIKGKRPKIYAEKIDENSGVNNADVSIRTVKVVFELPTNKSDVYTEAPFEGGNSCTFDATSTVEFKNLDALMANLDETLMIPLAKSLVANNTGINSAMAEPLPVGCSLVKETKDGATTVYLRVVTKGFSDWLSANGLTDGDAVCANGLTARQNYILGLTNNANSKPQIAKGDNGKFRYSINTASGATVALQVQKSSDGTSFSDFGTAQNNSVEIDPTTVSAGETAYYRVKIDLGNGLFTEQILGVINVENGANPAAIGVPFGKIGGHDGPPDQDAVSVEDVLVTSELVEGDIIYVYDQANKSYQAWRWNGSAWAAINTVTKEAITPAGAASSVSLPRGKAFWLERVDTAKPIILAGRYDTAGTTTAIETGWNLIASPKAASFNLNNNGVTGNGANDQILVPTAGAPIVYTYENGAWGRIVTEVKNEGGLKFVETSRSTENATVPAGHGFWYISAGGNTPTFNW